MPDKKQFERERVNCGSQFQGTVHRGGEAVMVEHEAAGHIVSIGNRTEFWSCVFFLFDIVGDPSPWDGTACIQK